MFTPMFTPCSHLCLCHVYTHIYTMFTPMLTQCSYLCLHDVHTYVYTMFTPVYTMFTPMFTPCSHLCLHHVHTYVYTKFTPMFTPCVLPLCSLWSFISRLSSVQAKTSRGQAACCKASAVSDQTSQKWAMWIEMKYLFMNLWKPFYLKTNICSLNYREWSNTWSCLDLTLYCYRPSLSVWTR